MLVFLILSFVGIKLYSQSKTALTGDALAAITGAGASSAGSGSAPDNGQPASPSPPLSTLQNGTLISQPVSQGDADDDGSMTATVNAVSGAASSDGDVVGFLGSFDTNETQDSSGADNPGSRFWRREDTAPRGDYNRILDHIWAECYDVDYMCSQPGIAYYYRPPGVSRQDWNPALNNQPWARNTSFQGTDPTSYFETEDDGITPSADNAEEDT